jgi:hypothetical protein
MVDVQLTGPDFDLDPNDGLADDNLTPVLAVQGMHWLLHMYRGEYPPDDNIGLNLMAASAERKTPRAEPIKADVAALARRVPNVTDVRITSSTSVGRTLSLTLAARWKAYRLEGRVLTSVGAEIPGADAPTQTFLAIHG